MRPAFSASSLGDQLGVGGTHAAAPERGDPINARDPTRDDISAEDDAERRGDILRGIATRTFDVNDARRGGWGGREQEIGGRDPDVGCGDRDEWLGEREVEAREDAGVGDGAEHTGEILHMGR